MGDDQRQFRRYQRNNPVRARINGNEFEAVLRDVSAGGAAITPDASVVYDNNMFVELHDSALGTRRGRIVRGLPEGFAMEFEQTEKERQQFAEELEKFQKTLGRGIA